MTAARRRRALRSTRTDREAATASIRYRPDVKLSGAYSLPFDIQLSGTYQFSRGVQTGGAGPSIQANWAVTSAVANPFIGRNWTGHGVADDSADSRGSRFTAITT